MPDAADTSLSLADREPAVLIGLIQTVAQAALGVIDVAAGLDPKLALAVHALAASVIALAGALWTRSKVSSTKELEAVAAMLEPRPRRKAAHTTP